MVTPGRYPSLTVRFSIQGYVGEVIALVDTGCDVALVVPEGLATNLPPPLRARKMRTATGQVVVVPSYIGSIQILVAPSAIDGLVIALGTEYLLGLPMLNQYRVTLDRGRRIIVEP